MKWHQYTFVWFMAMSVWVLSAQGQTKVYFSFTDTAASSPLLKGKKIIPDSFTADNKQALYNYCNDKYLQLIDMGYLSCSIDSIARHTEDSTYHVSIHLGQSYQWSKVSLDSIPPEVISKTGLRKMDWENKKVRPGQLKKLHQQLLSYYESNGFPFASITHHNTIYDSKGIHTLLKVDKGMFVKIDTLVIKGNVDISPAFMQNYLGIKQGDAYNEQLIKQITPKIKELVFLQEAAPWEMYQSIAQNELILNLKKKKANQINGLVGLQPSNNETGKMLLTIDALLDLNNSFGYGERIMASFQNLQKASPKLILGTQIPYILGLPIAAEANFDLYRRDTLFTRINFDGGVKYLINSKDYLKLSYIDASYRVNYVDLAFVQREKRLPNIVDTRSRGLGITLFLDKTDYNLAPKKGWVFRVSSNVLRRSVKENLQISTLEDGTGYDYSTLYDSLKAIRNLYKVSGNIDYYIPLTRNFILKTAYTGAWMQSQQLFMNELYQIGGYKILRGFDEESIFANTYHIGTLEFRMMINAYSFFYLFSDFGWYSTDFNYTRSTQKPLSLGGGLSLQNDNGIFRIAIGIGKKDGEPFQLRQTKLHFGYIALF